MRSMSQGRPPIAPQQAQQVAAPLTPPPPSPAVSAGGSALGHAEAAEILGCIRALRDEVRAQVAPLSVLCCAAWDCGRCLGRQVVWGRLS